MRITIEIDDGGIEGAATGRTTRPQERVGADTGGATAPPEVLATAAALGARNGGAAPQGPGEGLAGATLGSGPRAGGSEAPEAYLRTPPPPFPGGGAGAPAAFTGEGTQDSFVGAADASAGPAPGVPQAVAEVVEQASEYEPPEEEAEAEGSDAEEES